MTGGPGRPGPPGVSVLPLVPAPLQVTRGAGVPFALTGAVRVVAAEADVGAAADAAPDALVPAGAAGAVAHLLATLVGRPVPVVAHDDGSSAAVVLRLTRDRAALGVGPEVDDARAAGAYRLQVGADRVVLTALGAAGLVHAAATAVQTYGPDASGAPVLAAVDVVDVPRFGWRGLSLDVARHFFGLPVLRTVVDVLASLKLNVLHLHLTDDQGWRVHVPSRPELTARSGGTAVDGDPGGYLTADDLAELTAYAGARGIAVVPEIDLPGHVNAALHAYGELTPTGEPAPEYTGIEVGFSQLYVDLPATAPFLHDVLGDLAAMTPGDHVHIGGDEVLTMDADEYVRLVQLAAAEVRAAGKRVVGWQEIAKADLGPDVVLQLWEPPYGGDRTLAAVAAGARVLLSPGSRAYLDMKYDASTVLGLDWAGHIELRDAYDWDPLAILPGLDESSVVGIEAAMWSETIRTLDDLASLLLPRLAAVAEVAWSAPDRRDWAGFAGRVAGVTRHWDRAGLTWYRSPQVEW